MSKTSKFTTITPLPSTISRETAIEALHDHKLMIDLNPLVIDRKLVPKAPHFASAEEYTCKWYLITDRISYVPGRVVTGKVDYYACFHDLPDGVQTHCFAPLGLDIRSRWRVGGSLPGEPREAAELGLGIPKEGLYIREDVTMRCSIVLVSFVKKTFKKSHERLVDRLGEKVHVEETSKHNSRLSGIYGGSSPGTPPSFIAPGSPPPASVSPRYSAIGLTPQPPRPGSAASSSAPSSQFYTPSPIVAAQMAAQGLDPNNPQHVASFTSTPLYGAQFAGNPYGQQSGPGSVASLPYDPSLQQPVDPSLYPQPLRQAYPGQQPPFPHGSVEIASSELKHPAFRDGAPGGAPGGGPPQTSQVFGVSELEG